MVRTIIQNVRNIEATIRTGLKSSIGRNVFSLYALLFANYILPLVTIPYLVRVLGPEKFGVVAFGQSLMAYFVLVVNYGFNWSATRKISVHRDEPKVVNRTVISVWTAKALLCAICFLVLLVLIQFVPKFKEISLILFVLYGIILGNMLFPTWLFQGLERMVPISMINLIMRFLATVGIFAFVRQSEDFLLYAGLLSFQWVGAGLLGVWQAWKQFDVTFSIPCLREIREALKEGWPLFLSTGIISLYTVGNTFILGIMADYKAVGFYRAAEKLVRTTSIAWMPIIQAFFPRLNLLAAFSKTEALYWGRKVVSVVGVLGFIISIFLLLMAPAVVKLILGPGY